ncbi:type II toxin-antitoxin system VapB family antitoxin [Agrobacterium sp. AGB01]|nr:type II toxin-antitoxin system VapB family antitoxin [Agrobacterium sp. AGB01]
MGQLYIKDEAVYELAVAVMKATNAKSKTDAVRHALQDALKRAQETVPLRERVRELQDAVAAQRGPNPRPIDLKKISDELWED